MDKEIQKLKDKKIKSPASYMHRAGIPLEGKELEKCDDWMKFFDDLAKE